jgi:hypothetical protein
MTEETPAKLLLGRQLNTPFDNLRPNLHSKVVEKQWKQKEQYDKTSVNRTFKPGNLVYALNFGKGEKWLQGVIISKTGPVSFVAQLVNGGLLRRHQDQLRLRHVAAPPLEDAAIQVNIPVSQDIVQAPTVEVGLSQEPPVAVGESPLPSDGHQPPATTNADAVSSKESSPKRSDSRRGGEGNA